MKKSIFNPYLISAKTNLPKQYSHDLQPNDEQNVIDNISVEKEVQKDHSEIDLTSDPNEVIRNILNTDQRTEKDIWTLYESFKDSKFFRQYINNTDERERLNALLYLCKKLKYETWGPQRIIIKQGEYSNGKVYIVMSGGLTVLIKNTEKTEECQNRNDVSISAITDHEEIHSAIISNKK